MSTESSSSASLRAEAVGPAAASGPAQVRASDAEREEYARIVRDAVGEGRLSLDEGDERLAQVYAAKFREELRPLVRDLPNDDARSHGPHGARWGVERGSWGVERGDSAAEWRGARRAFARHAGFVAVVAAVLITIWLSTASHFFWPAIPLIFFSIGLYRHARWLGWRRRRWYANR
jgi:DUF1707 SHOCT-like domain